MKISAVVNTYNEETNITLCLASLKWVDELIVWDAESTDKTVELAKNFTDKVFVTHYSEKCVEVQRNDAIRHATGDWVLVIDADEKIPENLAEKLRGLSENADAGAYEIPRKNMIFGKWIEHAGWWPDYQLRFFKNGTVNWKSEIHSKPNVSGLTKQLDPVEDSAIIHDNYRSVTQFIGKLNIYTDIQAHEIKETGYHFDWHDLIKKPVSEFITRFFVWEGYKDGLHGFVLSILQGISFFVLYAKLWESSSTNVTGTQILEELPQIIKETNREINYWLAQTADNKSISAKLKGVLKR